MDEGQDQRAGRVRGYFLHIQFCYGDPGNDREEFRQEFGTDVGDARLDGFERGEGEGTWG